MTLLKLTLTPFSDMYENVLFDRLSPATQQKVINKYVHLSVLFANIFSDVESWQNKLFRTVQFIEDKLLSIKNSLNERACRTFVLSKKKISDLFYTCVVSPNKIFILVKHPYIKSSHKIIEEVINYETCESDDIRIKSAKDIVSKEMWSREFSVFDKIVTLADSNSYDLQGIFIPTVVKANKTTFSAFRSFLTSLGLESTQVTDTTKSYVFGKKCKMTLFEYLKQPLSLEQRIELAYNFATALNNFHLSVNLAHGDVNIYNALVIKNRIMLIDFALFQIRDIKSTEKSGTLGWAPPEYYDCEPTIDPRAKDAWCLGLVLFFIATSTSPSFLILQKSNGISHEQKSLFLNQLYAFRLSFNLNPDPIIDVALQLLREEPARRCTIPQAADKLGRLYSQVVNKLSGVEQTPQDVRPMRESTLDEIEIHLSNKTLYYGKKQI